MYDLSDLNLILQPGQSLQQQLTEQLRRAILTQRLLPGAALPPSRTLADELGIARNTVLRVYEHLLDEGFLEASRRGTRVAPLSALARERHTGLPTEIAGALSRRASALTPRGDHQFLPFAPGVPDLNAFPWPRWARELQRAWGEVSARQLLESPPGGEPALRSAIAAFLGQRRGVDCDMSQVFIFPGGQAALDACARLLADAGDTAWLEDPGYPTARAVLQTAGLNLRPIPVDHDGMRFAPEAWRQQPPRLLFLTPAHQYPLGSVLSLERRLALLNLAEAGQHWIVEDDYDSEFGQRRPGQRPLPAMQGLRADAPVVYLGTFSKLLYPGLRLAYVVLPRWAAARFGEAAAALYRTGHAVEQRALARFMNDGHLLKHLRHMAPIYAERQARLRAALQSGLGKSAEILGGQAGLHLCLRLPHARPDTAIAAAAAKHGIVVRALSAYCHDDAARAEHNGLVLGYGQVETGRIAELAARLLALC